MDSVAGLMEYSNHHGRYFFSPDMHGSFIVGGLACAMGDGTQNLQTHLEADLASKNTTNFAGERRSVGSRMALCPIDSWRFPCRESKSIRRMQLSSDESSSQEDSVRLLYIWNSLCIMRHSRL